MSIPLKESARVAPVQTPARSLASVTEPIEAVAQDSPGLLVCPPGKFELDGEPLELPRYLFRGPAGGGEPLRVALFAALHGDEAAGAFALVRFVQLLREDPEIARGYDLFLYPLCNPSGFVDNTRHSRNGKDLGGEFWRHSTQPEIRLLESELWSHSFHGLISLHSDHAGDGLYAYAHGALLTSHVLRPALVAASEFLPVSDWEEIEGLPARNGIIKERAPAGLHAPPGSRPRPFEIVLQAARQAPQYVQEAALLVAVRTILCEYRKFIAYGQDL